MSDEGPSMGEYEEGRADPPEPSAHPKPGTIGELAANIKAHCLIDLSCALTLLQADYCDTVPELAAAYKACWQALKPFCERESERLQQIVEAHGPPGLAEAPASLQDASWKRVRWSGNPPHSEPLFGWRTRLGRHTTADEKKWFHAQGFEFSGGWWGRPDGGFGVR